MCTLGRMKSHRVSVLVLACAFMAAPIAGGVSAILISRAAPAFADSPAAAAPATDATVTPDKPTDAPKPGIATSPGEENGSGSGSASGSGSGSGGDQTPPVLGDPGLGDIATAFLGGQWALGISLTVIFLVAAARKAGLWKQSKLGGWVLNFAGSFGVVMGARALAHVAITPSVLLSTTYAALTTAGLLELGRDLWDWISSLSNKKS